MKKKIILAIIVFSTLIACGKKGDPVYKDCLLYTSDAADD